MSIWKPVGGGGNAAGTVQRWRLRCLSRTPTAAAKNQSFRKAKTTVRFSTDYLEPGHWPSDTEAMEHVQRFQAAILDEINDRPQPRKTVAQDTHPTRVPRQHEREKLRLEDIETRRTDARVVARTAKLQEQYDYRPFYSCPWFTEYQYKTLKIGRVVQLSPK